MILLANIAYIFNELCYLTQYTASNRMAILRWALLQYSIEINK